MIVLVLLKFSNLKRARKKRGRRGRGCKSQIWWGIKILMGRGGVEIQDSCAMQEHLSTTILRFRDRKVHQTLLLSHKRAASNKIGTANPITVIFKICTVLILS